MECKKDENLKNCTCSYMSCGRRGVCCDCIQHHIKQRAVPGCFFSPDAEKTYDRSFEHFARLINEGKL
jgi:hypothetical protein